MDPGEFTVAHCPKCSWRAYSGSDWEASDLLEIHKEEVHPWL